MNDDDRSRDAEGTGAFQLDLDDDSTSDLESVFDEAVKAVERHHETPRPSADADTSGEDAPPPAGDASGDEASGAERAEAADLRDRLVRTLADFDNFRKRVERERETARRYAHGDVLRDLLGVVDNLERAATASGSADDLRLGVEMIARQLQDLLGRYGVERVAAAGRPFDPAEHEAVSRQESDAVTVPTVSQELQPGYRYHDRLLRPAMVNVAVPARAEASARADERS